MRVKLGGLKFLIWGLVRVWITSEFNNVPGVCIRVIPGRYSHKNSMLNDYESMGADYQLKHPHPSHAPKILILILISPEPRSGSKPKKPIQRKIP